MTESPAKLDKTVSLLVTGNIFLLDFGLMKQLAIRLSWQTTPAKSLVIRRNDGLINNDFIMQVASQ